MWLVKSSIGHKVIMAVTGAALVLFLTFHAAMNVVALISANGYNAVCEFLSHFSAASGVGTSTSVQDGRDISLLSHKKRKMS